MISVRIFGFILLALWLVGGAGAESLVLSPSDDMYSDPEHPGTQTPEELWVANYSGAGQFQRIMIRFDLEAVRGPEVHEAILNLYRFFVCPMDPYTLTDIHAITQPWDEDTWPDDQHIAYDPTPRVAFAFGPDNPSWFIIDLTDLVRAWVAGDIENHGLVIIARSGEKWSKFYSKEYANPDLRPFLEVDYTSADVADGIATPRALALTCTAPAANAGTRFSFAQPAEGPVLLRVFDASGRPVRTVIEGRYAAGRHSAQWNGRNERGVRVSPGVYLCILRTPSAVARTKAVILR
jgi:hypothetical protein